MLAESALMNAQYQLSEYRQTIDRHQRRDRLDLVTNELNMVKIAIDELTSRLDAPGG